MKTLVIISVVLLVSCKPTKEFRTDYRNQNLSPVSIYIRAEDGLFDGRDLRETSFHDGNFDRSSLRNVKLGDATKCDFSYCDFTGAEFYGKYTGSDFRGAALPENHPLVFDTVSVNKDSAGQLHTYTFLIAQ